MSGEMWVVASSAATLVVLLAVFVLTGLVVLKLIQRLPGGKVAEVEADENRPFELRYATIEARSYRLCATIRYHGTGGGGIGDASYTCLECDLHVTAGDRVDADETVSFHKQTSEDADRVITTAYMSSELRDGSYLTRKGTYVLVEIPRCPAGTEIVVKGTFRPMPGTDVSMLDVFIGR